MTEYGVFLQSGTILADKYVIESLIGKGGMSNVYLAVDIRLKKKWAVKEISPYTCEDYTRVTETLLAEAGILTRLDHPCLPRIVDIFRRDRSMILVMDYIRGQTLAGLLERSGRFEEEDVVRWGIRLADVLGYLHRQNPPVIYRDMKPSNVMIKEDGSLTLIDFGTAREYSRTERGDTLCLGTRGYAAPEQYGGYGQTDIRTDIYGLGATLYHMLTGKNPSAPPYSIRPVRQLVPYASPGIERILEQCTRPDPADRFQNMEDLGYALRHLKESSKAFLSKEKKKIFAASLLFFAAFLCFVMTGILKIVTGSRKRTLTDYYIRQASFAAEDTARQDYLIRALDVLPGYSPTYEAILDSYVGEGIFSTGEEAMIISLTSRQAPGGTGLDLLRKRDSLGYCNFCYRLGLACFFDMGGRKGKCDAGRWFAGVEKTKAAGFESEKRVRAGLYRQISDYYREYIDRGDSSGETGKSYQELFAILGELNKIELSSEDDDAKVAAAYFVSKEVLMEIIEYGDRFLENGIEAGDLKKEVRRIRERSIENPSSRLDIFRVRRSEEDYRQMINLLQDAERKLEMQ